MKRGGELSVGWDTYRGIIAFKMPRAGVVVVMGGGGCNG